VSGIKNNNQRKHSNQSGKNSVSSDQTNVFKGTANGIMKNNKEKFY